jgi:Leucine-rich repeat
MTCTYLTSSLYLQDQHDAIDLTDNSIITLGNLPLLKRLRTLLLANNRISAISPSIHLSVPNLTTLVLTNNNIVELGDLEPLKELKGLKYLSLMGNPVREKKWYREWLAWRLPALRVIDFQRIRDKVRTTTIFLGRSRNSWVCPGASSCSVSVPHWRKSSECSSSDNINYSVDAVKNRCHHRRA